MALLEYSMHSLNSFLVIAEEESGGLFDFDSTMPMMAITILIFMSALNLTFFSPILANIDERDNYIGENLTEAKTSLAKANELTERFEAQLVEARSKSQQKISESQKEAQAIVSSEIEKAKADSEQLFVKLNNQLLQQKEEALSNLQGQTADFEKQIYDRFVKVFFPAGI